MLNLLGRRKDKRAIILPPWESLVPGRRLDEATMADWGPPTKVNASGEVNLDFGALTLVDNAIIDKTSTDILLAQKNATLRGLRESIRQLQDEGFLITEDLVGRVASRRSDLQAEVDAEMLRWEHWIPTIRPIIFDWDRQRKERQKVASDEYNEHLHAPGAIRDYLLAQGEPLTYENIGKLELLICSPKKRRTTEEKNALRYMTKYYLEYTFTNIIARAEFCEPFLDWSNLKNVYTEKMRLTGVGPQQTEQMKVTEFFRLAFPTLEPTTAQQLLALRNDKRLSEFRSLISEAAKTGQRFDDGFSEKVAVQISKVLAKTKGPKRLISALGATAGIVEAFALGAPIVSALASVATSATQEAAGATLEKFLTKDMDWLFCLVDAAAPKRAVE